ncbi:hypothetical protein PFISCL1PPCAC_18205, partial [Pristionchus fissidentatus]
CDKVNKLFSDRASVAVKNTIRESSRLKNFLIMLASVRDTINAKRKTGDGITSVYREFVTGTVEDAMKVIASKKNTTSSRKSNGAIQPSIFRVADNYHIAVCGREVNVGSEEGSDTRALFLLLALFMVFDLSYTTLSSDILSFLELSMGYPQRKGMSSAAKGMFNLINEL